MNAIFRTCETETPQPSGSTPEQIAKIKLVAAADEMWRSLALAMWSRRGDPGRIAMLLHDQENRQFMIKLTDRLQLTLTLLNAVDQELRSAIDAYDEWEAERAKWSRRVAA